MTAQSQTEGLDSVLISQPIQHMYTQYNKNQAFEILQEVM